MKTSQQKNESTAQLAAMQAIEKCAEIAQICLATPWSHEELENFLQKGCRCVTDIEQSSLSQHETAGFMLYYANEKKKMV